MSAACRRAVQAGETTYALRVTRTVSKSFVCNSEALNVSVIIGQCFSLNVHWPIARRKSASHVESPFSLCNSRNRSFADTARSARLFLVGGAA
jgi:hypothetical protein